MRNVVIAPKKLGAAPEDSILSIGGFPGRFDTHERATSATKSRSIKADTGDSRRRALDGLLRDISATSVFSNRNDLSSFVNWKGNAEAPIHRWLRYREAYSPHLITKLALGNRILDPFCGCGSIMIGSAENGYTSAGIDINPLAVFAGRVKLTPISRPRLAKIKAFVDQIAAGLTPGLCWPAPDLSISGKVFEPEILYALLRIRGMIEQDFSGEKDSRDFLHLAWISILETVGSYFKEGNGIKYRNKKRLKTGYIRRTEGEWQIERFGTDQTQFVNNAFCSQVRAMLDDTRYWRKGTWGDQKIIEGNVLEMGQLLGDRTFDSVIFSPPYANRFDYIESMKVELWFGGFVDSYEAGNRFRKASLRSHLGADLSRPYQPNDILERLIALMDTEASSWRMGVPALLRGYFDDMRVTLINCRKTMRDGKCFVVVGNSAFAGVIIPTDVLLAKMAVEAGFNKAEIWITRHLTVAPQQRNKLCGLEDHMRESVVMFS